MYMCRYIFVYMHTCMDGYIYLQIYASRKLGKEYSQNWFVKISREENV